MDLSKGEGGQSGSKTYVADNGVIVQATAPVYTHQNAFYIGYMFNRNMTDNGYTNYWLPIEASNKNESLLFTFPEDINLSHFNVCATSSHTNNADSDRGSNYTIEVRRSNGGNWIPITSAFVDTANDTNNKMRCHEVRMKNVSKVRVNLDRRKKYHAIKEIDIYVV